MADMENSFLEGNGIVILLLFLLMFGWGGNGFGNFGGNAAMQGAMTRAELYEGFNTNEIKSEIDHVVHGQYDLNTSILNNRYENAVGMAALDKSVMQNRFDTLLGQNGLSAQIAQNKYDAALQAQAAQAQMANCCCDIKTALHAEGEATRAMIQQQTIDDLTYKLNQANTAVANAVQTQNITGQMRDMMNAMGRWYANPPANPYIVYGNNGCCNNGYSGCGGCTA